MIVLIQYLLLMASLTFAFIAIARIVMPRIQRMRININLSTFVVTSLILVAIHVGASKSTITYDDYLIDAGSYVTNDYVHVAISRATDIMPTSTEILVYYRENSSSNAADWVQFSPTYTFADHPHDYSLPNATNYNYLVVANFAPSPTVHTNGVWQARGFEFPNDRGKYTITSSKLKAIEDPPYRYKVEYLQSSGTQYIDTKIPGLASYEYRITAADNACTQYSGLLGVAAWDTQSIFVQTGPKTNLGAYWHGMTSPSFSALDAKVSFAFGNGYKIVDGVKTTTSNNINKNIGLNVLVLGPASSLTSSYYCACKVYNFSIVDSNDNLLIDLIPVVDDDGVACMFDRVTQTFFYNKGTGSFTAGPRID